MTTTYTHTAAANFPAYLRHGAKCIICGDTEIGLIGTENEKGEAGYGVPVCDLHAEATLASLRGIGGGAEVPEHMTGPNL